MIGVVVDAKHEEARSYYECFEFERFPDSPLTLWVAHGRHRQVIGTEIHREPEKIILE